MKKSTKAMLAALGVVAVLAVALAISVLVSPNDDTQTPDPSPSSSEVPTTPVTPDKPQEPEKPASSEQPEEPDAPTKPDTPQEPEKPVEPDKPQEPEKPTTPQKPTANLQPYAGAYIRDEVGVFTKDEISAIENAIATWQKEYGTKLIIVVANEEELPNDTSAIITHMAALRKELALEDCQAVLFVNMANKMDNLSHAKYGKFTFRKETVFTITDYDAVGTEIVGFINKMSTLFAKEAAAEAAKPPEKIVIPENYIQDTANVLTEKQVNQLKAYNKAWAEKYGFQVGLVIIDEQTAGMSLADYATKTKTRWDVPTNTTLIVLSPYGSAKKCLYPTPASSAPFFKGLSQITLLTKNSLTVQNVTTLYAQIDEYMATGNVVTGTTPAVKAPAGGYQPDENISTDGESKYIIDEKGVFTTEQLAVLMKYNANWNKNFGFRTAITITEAYRPGCENMQSHLNKLKNELGLKEGDTIVCVVIGDRTECARNYGKNNPITKESQADGLKLRVIDVNKNPADTLTKYFADLDAYLNQKY